MPKKFSGLLAGFAALAVALTGCVPADESAGPGVPAPDNYVNVLGGASEIDFSEEFLLLLAEHGIGYNSVGSAFLPDDMGTIIELPATDGRVAVDFVSVGQVEHDLSGFGFYGDSGNTLEFTNIIVDIEGLVWGQLNHNIDIVEPPIPEPQPSTEQGSTGTTESGQDGGEDPDTPVSNEPQNPTSVPAPTDIPPAPSPDDPAPAQFILLFSFTPTLSGSFMPGESGNETLVSDAELTPSLDLLNLLLSYFKIEASAESVFGKLTTAVEVERTAEEGED